MFKFCDSDSLITSSSASVVKYIGLPVLGSSWVHMDTKAKLNVEYLEIDTTLLQNTENRLNPDCISKYVKLFSE